MERVGLEGVSLHFLRHSHASELLSKGVPLPDTVLDNRFMPVLAYNECSAGKSRNTRVSWFGLSTRRQRLGFALYQAQIGQKHESAKMLQGFAETVWQVRADDPGGTYRAVYVAQFGEAVYVLHAFQKKATSGIATPQRELDLIRQRLQLARKLVGK